MYSPWELTIYPSSYGDIIGRKAGKTPSIMKLTGKWSGQGLLQSESFEVCPALLGPSATFQAATKVNHGCSIVTKPALVQSEQEMERSSPCLRAKTNMIAEAMVICMQSLSRCEGGRHETKHSCRNWRNPPGFQDCRKIILEGPTYKWVTPAKSKVTPSEDLGGGHSSDDGEDITTSPERRTPALGNAFLERREV